MPILAVSQKREGEQGETIYRVGSGLKWFTAGLSWQEFIGIGQISLRDILGLVNTARLGLKTSLNKKNCCLIGSYFPQELSIVLIGELIQQTVQTNWFG